MKEFLASLLPLGGVLLKAVIIALVGLVLIRLVMQVLEKLLEKTKLEKAAYSLLKTLV